MYFKKQWVREGKGIWWKYRQFLQVQYQTTKVFFFFFFFTTKVFKRSLVCSIHLSMPGKTINFALKNSSVPGSLSNQKE